MGGALRPSFSPPGFVSPCGPRFWVEVEGIEPSIPACKTGVLPLALNPRGNCSGDTGTRTRIDALPRRSVAVITISPWRRAGVTPTLYRLMRPVEILTSLPLVARAGIEPDT